MKTVISVVIMALVLIAANVQAGTFADFLNGEQTTKEKPLPKNEKAE